MESDKLTGKQKKLFGIAFSALFLGWLIGIITDGNTIFLIIGIWIALVAISPLVLDLMRELPKARKQLLAGSLMILACAVYTTFAAIALEA